MNSHLPPFLFAWNACAERARQPLSVAAEQASRRSWYDTLATMAAGTAENCTRAALQACEIPEGGALSAVDAALVLGTASHALDYDDVCMLATCHPSAPPISALLGLLPQLMREREGITLSDLLAAHLVGTETMLRLGAWLGFRHYALGFHATSTLGTVGSAAAVAHALQLPDRAAHAALSIAASSACGLRANFGSDVKPLHVGFAAAAGVRAGLLARAGIEASNDVWQANGFELAFNGGEPVLPIDWGTKIDWAIVHPGFEFKRYPSCYLSHRLIAGILAIRARQPTTTWSQPVKISIEVARNGLAALKYPQPRTGLQGKFSGPYCAAAAWIDGAVGLATFSDVAVQRPAVLAGMQHVQLRERARAGEQLDTAPVHVVVCGRDWSDTIKVDWAPGSSADPVTRSQMTQKMQDCLDYGGLNRLAGVLTQIMDAPLDAPVSLLMPLREAMLSARKTG